MILLSLIIGSLQIIASYAITFYIISNDSDMQNVIIARLEEKLTNTESNWYRVLLRFSILVLEINFLIFTSISSSISFIQQQQNQQQHEQQQEQQEQEEEEEEQQQQQQQQQQEQQQEQQQQQQEQQQEQQIERLEDTKAVEEIEDLLIRCIAQRLESSNGRPVAACFIYKCLRQWKSFEVEKTNIFDQIIQTIDHDIETNNNKDVLAYWLSNTSMLLVLLQRTFEASETTVEDRIEAKNSVLLFKHQLTTYVEKIYEMIRENLKEELVPLVHSCSQAARGPPKNNIPIRYYWQQIVENILDFLKILDSNNVPPFLVRKIFTQIFSFINVRIFNSFLVRRECCSSNHGEYNKEGLSELKSWCQQVTEKYAGLAWDELKLTGQATEFLGLNIQQLYKISTMYRDYIYNTTGISPDVISKMREDSYGNDSKTFFLDEDLSIPFSVDDLSKSMDQINIADIEPPPLIRDHSGFNFLSQSL